MTARVEVPGPPDSPGPPEAVDEEVGHRIRRLRQRKGLSARELAAAAGVSAAYLSRLENARVSPTVATLGRVVQAMDETIGSLFETVPDDDPVVRATQRRTVRSRGVTDYRVTPGWSTRLEVLESVVGPGEQSGDAPHTHAGDEEFVLVLEGKLTVWIDGTGHRLRAGDAATFACRTPHRWQNTSTRRPCRALWVFTPALY